MEKGAHAGPRKSPFLQQKKKKKKTQGLKSEEGEQGIKGMT